MEQIKINAEEINELRAAARQLMAGLTEYAKKENWQVLEGDGHPFTETTYVWLGGEGPKVARKFLGLDEEKN